MFFKPPCHPDWNILRQPKYLFGSLFLKETELQSTICRTKWQDAFYIEDHGFFFSEGGYAGLAKSNKLAMSNGQNHGGVYTMLRSLTEAGDTMFRLGFIDIDPRVVDIA